ncbi:metal-dependent hydrolase [Halobellus inordinatus]|uniref:metal-dependent hydrolase n=1 Tax=Halobellus inordinatus TaxID=1126236 RepID=UPI00211580C8|nr:metal-dependent hydrolase [Halobellus ramosii]
MRPVEHFIVAFLPLAAAVLLKERKLPSLRFVGVVFVGSQFPDLIDKPLAHEFGVIPSGRVFMHSVPIALPVLAVVVWYGWRTQRRRLSIAFVVAYASHLLADNYRALFGPGATIPPDLLWPITQPTPRPAVPYWAGPYSINLHLWTLFSATILAILVYVLKADVKEQLNQ